jgi:hypothetical protein
MAHDMTWAIGPKKASLDLLQPILYYVLLTSCQFSFLRPAFISCPISWYDIDTSLSFIYSEPELLQRELPTKAGGIKVYGSHSPRMKEEDKYL